MPHRDSSDDSPIALMRRIVQAHGRMFEAETGATDITRQQFVVMRALVTNPKATQIEIAAATGIDRSTISDIKNRLKAKGFIRSARREDDMRANAAVITSEGLRTYKKVQRHFGQAERTLMAALSGPSRHAMTEWLQTIIYNVEKKEASNA